MIKAKYMGPLCSRLASADATIVIGRVLAQTTLTQTMIDDMIEATLRGEAIHTYFDGEALHVDRLEIRAK